MRGFIRSTASAVMLLVLIHTTGTAQGFTGTYSTKSRQGGTVTLVLRQDAQGRVTGTMSGSGTGLTLEGTVDEDVAVGAMSGNGAAVFFQAELDGGQLRLTLIEPGPGNQPDYSRTREVLLTRVRDALEGGPSAGVAPTPPRRGDASQRAAEPRGQAASARGLLGRWACQTASGPAQLAFTSERQLVFNGEASEYQLAPGVIRVAGDYGPVEYRYELQGDRLAVTGPDGSTMQCQRQGDAGPDRAAAQGGGEGGGYESLLQGRLCSFSSSYDGGTATVRTLLFDGRGRFKLSSETSFGLAEGFGWGQGDPDAGSYRVMGPAVGARIVLVTPSGETVTAAAHHVYGGEITEVMVNGRLYGKAICE